MASPSPESMPPSLLEYLKARWARFMPRWSPAAWARSDDWFAAREAEAAAASPSEPRDRPRAAAAPLPTRPRAAAGTGRAAKPEAQDALPRSRSRADAFGRWPWALTLAVSAALVAQLRLEPAHRQVGAGLAWYALAIALLLLAARRGEFTLTPPARGATLDFALTLRVPALVAAAVVALAAFLAFGGNRFHGLNLTLWALLLGLLLVALLEPATWRAWRARWATWRTHGVHFRLAPSVWPIVAVLALGIFLRFYQLAHVPREMFSDHAEKLYDVMDVLDGQWRIFFPRNTGREGMHMYTAALAVRLGAGVSYLALKLPMAVAAAVFLPVLYAFGRLWDSRGTGFWAAAFAGVAYWLHTVHRVGLRFMLYPTFTALTLYFVLRGLQRNRRDDFVWAGLFLGLGLHGYSPFRIVPLVVVFTFVWYGLHHRARPVTRRLGFALLLVVLVSLAVFLPLLRYMVDAPDMFFYRMSTRLAETERPYPGSPVGIFIQNVARGLVMFWWDNGSVWADSVMHRPALDPPAAALLALGVVLVAARYVRHRRWQDGWLLVLIPLLQLPSTLALAFPEENPTLHRTGAAMLPVFLLVGLAAHTVQQAWARRRAWGWALAGLLWLASWQASHDLVFRQYVAQYRLSNWNTPEIGQVVGGFARSVGEPDQVWVVPYPYWVDTRLVGIEAGYPRRDYALPREFLAQTLTSPAPKLFILKPEDEETLAQLWALYPHARVWRYRSEVEGKDFLMYFVPSEAP